MQITDPTKSYGTCVLKSGKYNEVAVLKQTDVEPVPSKKKRPPFPATVFDMKVEAPIATVDKVEVGGV